MSSEKFEPVGSGRAWVEDESGGWLRRNKYDLFNTSTRISL